MVLRALGALVIIGVIAGGGAWFYAQQQFDAPVVTSAEPVLFEVQKGASYQKVGRDLAAAGVLKTDRWWRLYPKLRGPPAGPKAGKHALQPGSNIAALIATLAENPIPDEVDLTFVEGWRVRDADKAFAEKGLITAGDLIAAASNPGQFTTAFPLEGAADLEGYLFPETYRVPEGKLDVNALIQRQLDAFNKRFYEPHQAELKKSGRTLRDVVIMASLLEREEPKPSLRPKVAGVLYKRLDAKTPLGVDATSRFTLKKWNERKPFLKKLRDPSDPYNTRLKAGLPPGPIGAPSLPSLTAAMRAQPSPYWYYLHDKQGNIHFGKTAAEHEQNRKRYNVW